ncbi:hypothetical protein B0H14DRAFT_3432938 [Mycena olivaceomarginata]|nr:hypothetical protein B0H14DRAFT_3432938 [Mycena olivaceomarginata]
MKILFSLLFALILSVDTFAAPVPNAQAGDEFGLEVRKAKAVAKKPAKAPVKVKPVVVHFYFSSVISHLFSHPTFI